jgi:hypothetical protein
MKRANSANLRPVLVALIAAVAVVSIVWMFRPHPPHGVVPCSDGPHQLIDATQFQTQYWSYSLKLEASASNKFKLGGELVPNQLQKLSEALQQGNEIRKWLVNSYNACAVSQSNYQSYGQTFARMDNIARSISQLDNGATPNENSRKELDALVAEYVQLSRELGKTK